MAVNLPHVRARLAGLGFDSPIHPDSTSLVTSLLDALETARAKNERLIATADQQASALFSAEATPAPLRRELGRLVRENNALHAEVIAVTETAQEARREQDAASSSVHGRVRDLSHLCSSLRGRVAELERENAGLREMASRTFETNGIVLPSGHEVRWHGRKERMEAHSPVAPVALGAGAGDRTVPEWARPTTQVPAGVAARLVQAAESQLSALLTRVEAGDDALSRMEAQTTDGRRQLQARETEVLRLGEQLSVALQAGLPEEARRAEQQSAAAALAQLSGQVDFLNAHREELESQLAAASRAARARGMEDEERGRYIFTIGQLRHDKARLAEELENAAKLTGALGLARPASLLPFAA